MRVRDVSFEIRELELELISSLKSIVILKSFHNPHLTALPRNLKPETR